MRARLVALSALLSCASLASRAHADESSGLAENVEAESVEAVNAALARDADTDAGDVGAPVPTDAAPPPRPYEPTLVLDSSIGALAFLGSFGKVAPPGPWLHVQLGYELLRWLMVYGEGELAFTDTSNMQPAPRTRAFSIFGFGAGARLTARFGDRFGAYLQPGLGLLKADIATGALGVLGFRDAESLGLWLGGRIGVEYYQVDRHLALGLNSQLRLAQGFARTGSSRGAPLALDGGIALRYAF